MVGIRTMRLIAKLSYYIRSAVESFVGLIASDDRKAMIANRLLARVYVVVSMPDGNRIFLRPCVKGDISAVLGALYMYNDNSDTYTLLKNTRVVVDAGAHIGIYTLKAARELLRKGKVIAIEPHPENYRLLMRNIQINGYGNIVPFDVALSDKDAMAKLFHSPNTLSHSLVFHHSNEWTWVETKTLDRLLNELGINYVNYIKLNIEGAELSALKGAQNTLNSARKLKILVNAHSQSDMQHIERYLLSMGFNAEVSGQHGFFTKVLN